MASVVYLSLEIGFGWAGAWDRLCWGRGCAGAGLRLALSCGLGRARARAWLGPGFGRGSVGYASASRVC